MATQYFVPSIWHHLTSYANLFIMYIIQSFRYVQEHMKQHKIEIFSVSIMDLIPGLSLNSIID